MEKKAVSSCVMIIRSYNRNASVLQKKTSAQTQTTGFSQTFLKFRGQILLQVWVKKVHFTCLLRQVKLQHLQHLVLEHFWWEPRATRSVAKQARTQFSHIFLPVYGFRKHLCLHPSLGWKQTSLFFIHVWSRQSRIRAELLLKGTCGPGSPTYTDSKNHGKA